MAPSKRCHQEACLAIVKVLRPRRPPGPHPLRLRQMDNRQIVSQRVTVLNAPRTCYLVKWRGYDRVEDLTCEPRHNVHVPVAYVPSIDQRGSDYRVCKAHKEPGLHAPFHSGPTGSVACGVSPALPAGQCSVPPPPPPSVCCPGSFAALIFLGLCPLPDVVVETRSFGFSCPSLVLDDSALQSHFVSHNARAFWNHSRGVGRAPLYVQMVFMPRSDRETDHRLGLDVSINRAQHGIIETPHCWSSDPGSVPPVPTGFLSYT
jgi:hypothetical protein